MVPKWVSLVLPALIIGAIVALVLFVVLGAGVSSPLLTLLLWPGARLGELMGAGYPVHDLPASFITVFIDILFYGTVAFLVMLLTGRHTGPKSIK